MGEPSFLVGWFVGWLIFLQMLMQQALDQVSYLPRPWSPKLHWHLFLKTTSFPFCVPMIAVLFSSLCGCSNAIAYPQLPSPIPSALLVLSTSLLHSLSQLPRGWIDSSLPLHRAEWNWEWERVSLDLMIHLLKTLPSRSPLCNKHHLSGLRSHL